MEGKKRKSEVKGTVPGGSLKRGRGEETTVTEEEVEEFFTILGRIHVAVDYFKKRDGDLRDLTDLRKVGSFSLGGNVQGNGGQEKAANTEENVGLDLNADPDTISDPV
ncbi:protein NIM1-INTERACTING 2-like [Hibiscus syriacus]|uniref:protein NIM1-INTERACTING 2-like n=1 Tax=Hibiscus syriacus TaxID=106335 RepID=UPI00192355C5|nr:protein NIM1-INTERACTING 2-like [Hibiscus syriacus]